jgi:hypothetical protein
MLRIAAIFLLFGSWAPATFGQAASPQPMELVFTLNALSHVSFDDQLVLPIAAGEKLHLLSYPHQDGSAAALRVPRAGLGTRSVSIPGGSRLFAVELLGQGKGAMRSDENGSLVIELDLVVRLESEAGRRDWPLHLTTEGVESWNAQGTKRFAVEGSRVDPASKVVQLVGSTSAGTDNEVARGAAIYLVLSGTFDRVPSLTASSVGAE